MKLQVNKEQHVLILARELHEGTRRREFLAGRWFVDWDDLKPDQQDQMVEQAKWIMSKYRILA